uniref:Uncharacterized protein n=1 Tax=Nelumbo nucifera TaxID=4432 RepID=A0A822YB04_NELNU|nr:TPA_asm: hypothetical protein HUJ06_030179 [Nelumbo nucifera]
MITCEEEEEEKNEKLWVIIPCEEEEEEGGGEEEEKEGRKCEKTYMCRLVTGAEFSQSEVENEGGFGRPFENFARYMEKIRSPNRPKASLIASQL